MTSIIPAVSAGVARTLALNPAFAGEVAAVAGNTARALPSVANVGSTFADSIRGISQLGLA